MHIGVVFITLNIYCLSAISLFAVLGFLASQSLSVISEEIQTIRVRGTYTKLQKWWRKFVVAREFIEHLHQSFQLILLIDICCIFVSCVINFFLCTFDMETGDLPFIYGALAYVLMNFSRLFTITYVTSSIQHQVRYHVTSKRMKLILIFIRQAIDVQKSLWQLPVSDELDAQVFIVSYYIKV